MINKDKYLYYRGSLDSFKKWISTLDKTSEKYKELYQSVVWIHPDLGKNDEDSSSDSGWIYAHGSYFSATSIEDIMSAVVETDIPIAGGPLASEEVANVFDKGKISAGTTIQQILEKLFLKELWGNPSGPTYTFTTSVSTPTISISSTGNVKVGTQITCSATANTTQSTTQKATVTGYSYGYSIDGTTKTSSDTSYTQNVTPSKTGTTSLSASFSGLYNIDGTTISNNTGNTTISYIGEGRGTYSATYTGQEVVGESFTTVDIYNVSNVNKVRSSDKKTISQVGFQESAVYNNGTLAAPTASSSKSVTGVWGYFYKIITTSTLPDMTSDDIRKWTWTASKPSKININKNVYGIAIACPTGSVTNIQQSDPNASFGTIQTVSVDVDAENNYNASHNYKVCYIKNDGVTTTSQTLTITYA